MQYSNGSRTILYPNKYQNADATTTTSHIFLGDQMIATVEKVGTTTTVHYAHTDHLSGANIATDNDGLISEVTDYYPYGSTRMEEILNGNVSYEQRKFTGHELDLDTNFTYAGARYYDGSIGRFRSVDPAFLAAGNPGDLKSKTGLDLRIYLSDPQGLNSYSYARNNPMRLVDPQGDYYREASTGYVGLKGYGFGLIEDTIGVARANINIVRNSSTINSYANSNIIKSIIFEEQSHGLDDMVTDRYPIFSSGSTVGLGQITVDDENTSLGYGSYSRADLLNPATNIGEINNRINSITSQLGELGITADNENFVGYVSSAYNNQNNLGVISNYGKRVQAYYNDVSSEKLLVPENRAAGKVIQSLNLLRKKLSE